MKGLSLTIKMVLVTLITGITMFVIADYFVAKKSEKRFLQQLTDTLQLQAVEGRNRFDKVIKTQHLFTRMVITFEGFFHHIESAEWLNIIRNPSGEIKIHYRPPKWLPEPSILRAMTQPGYILLIDKHHQVREAFVSAFDDKIPDSFQSFDKRFIDASLNVNFMALIEGKPFIISSAQLSYEWDKDIATLMIATPVDDFFLDSLSGHSSLLENQILALTTGLNPYILASNHPDILKNGTTLSELEDEYLFIGETLFNYEFSDLLVTYSYLFPKIEIEDNVNNMLAQERQQLFIIALSFILISSLVTAGMSRRIQILMNKVVNFSQESLGLIKEQKTEGDQLAQLEVSFQHLTAEVVASNKEQSELLTTVIASITSPLFVLDQDGLFIKGNPAFSKLFSIDMEAMQGQCIDEFLPWFLLEHLELATRHSVQDAEYHSLECSIGPIKKDKRYFLVDSVRFVDRNNEVAGMVILMADITELKSSQMALQSLNLELEDRVKVRTQQLQDSLHSLQTTQKQLVQAQKMEAIGQLSAGIAHEINTPTQYVSDNTHFLSEAFEDLKGLLEVHQQIHTKLLERNEMPEERNKIESVKDEIDYDFLMTEIPAAMNQCQDGLKQISLIVRAMKDFTTASSEEFEKLDLNHLIQNTILISRNEWIHSASIKTELEPDLPKIEAIPQKLSQVVLNLILNAAHALDGVGTAEKTDDGVITFTSYSDDENVIIRCSDNGPGIPHESIERLFDPFFTTKAPGSGSGQGLATSYSIIVQIHHGVIAVENGEHSGATFTITLPRNQPKE